MRLAGAALLVLAVPGPALAQAYQCSLPQRITPLPPPRPDGLPRRPPIAGYTLAASWSPEFCRWNARGSPIQCGGGHGRFGFVLHGLWPQAARGPSPQWCALTPRPSPELVRRHLCMSPAPALLEQQWAKHGSCMVRRPESYFRVAGILWRSLRWPDLDRLSRDEALTAGDIRAAFVLANPDWRARQVGLAINERGWLRELRLCYSRQFTPEACPRERFGPVDTTPVKVWRGL